MVRGLRGCLQLRSEQSEDMEGGLIKAPFREDKEVLFVIERDTPIHNPYTYATSG